MKKTTWVWVILLCFLLIFVKNIAFWSSEQTFIFGDSATYILHIANISQHFDKLLSLKESPLLWDSSHLSLGIPHLSLVDSGTLYPINLVIAAISYTIGNPLATFPLYMGSLYAHLLVASIFIFLILNRYFKKDNLVSLIGALLWLGSSFNLEFLASGPVLITASYLPVVIYFTLKERRFLRNILLACSFLAGYPMIPLLIWVVSLVLNFVKREGAGKNITAFIKSQLADFFFIILPIILPLYLTSFYYLKYSVRSDLTLAGFLQNPVPLSNLLQVILPTNIVNPQNNATNNLFLGVSLIALTILVQQRKYLKKLITNNKILLAITIMSLISLLISLGAVTPLPAWLYFFIPVASLFRRLSIFSLLVPLGGSIITPLAIDADNMEPGPGAVLTFWWKSILVVTVVITLINIGNSGPNREFSFGNPELLLNTLFISLFFTLTAWLSLNLVFKKPEWGKLAVIALLTVEASALAQSKWYINSTVNPKDVLGPNELIKYVQATRKENERVDLNGLQQSYGTGYFDIEQTAGYVSLASEYGVVISDYFLNQKDIAQNLYDVLSISYAIKKPGNLTDGNGWKLIRTFQQPSIEDKSYPQMYFFEYQDRSWKPDPVGSGVAVYHNSDRLERLYIAQQEKEAEQNKKLLDKISQEETATTVFLKNPRKTRGRGKIEELLINRNWQQAKVAAQEEVFIANSTAYYPGWKIRIDKGPWQKPTQTNWFMMGAYVPAGEHTIEFRYFPATLKISGLYIAAILIGWVTYAYSKTKRSK